MLGALTTAPAEDTVPTEVVQPVPQQAVQTQSVLPQQTVLPQQQTTVPNLSTDESNSAQGITLASKETQPEMTVSFTTGSNQVASASALQEQTSGVQGTQGGEVQQQNAPVLVQNNFGQILTIYQAGKNEEELPATTSPGTTNTATGESQPIDIDNNYIRAHLPNETSPETANEGSEQPQDTPEQVKQPETTITPKEPAKETFAGTEQTVAPKGTSLPGPESQPLVFAHQRFGEQTTASSSTSALSSFTLPSGSTVPETTVIDQMLSHFSVNKRLETGTVNLKLYPQELGELRMEIKVEQDNIKAHIVAQNPQAQEMIDRHLPRLRESLEQQGLHLQEVEVTLAAQDNATSERFQDSNAWRQPSSSPQRTPSDQSIFTLEPEESVGIDNSISSTLSVLA
jgi:flagellar hook-length control protein FliK